MTGEPTPPDNLPVLRAAAPAPAVGEAVEQAGQVLLGAVLLLGEGVGAVLRQVSPPPPSDGPPAGPSAAVVARRVAVGAAFDAQRRAVAVADATTKVVGPTLRWALAGPVVAPAVRRVAERLDQAYQAGLLEEEQARDLAVRTGEQTINLAVPVVLSEVDLKPVIEQVLGELDLPALVTQVMDQLDLAPIVEQVIGQLDLASLVNDVVGELQMSSVVLEATGGITGEVVEQVRSRSADGDAIVERIVAKVLRRRVDALPPPAAPVEDQP